MRLSVSVFVIRCLFNVVCSFHPLRSLSAIRAGSSYMRTKQSWRLSLFLVCRSIHTHTHTHALYALFYTIGQIKCNRALFGTTYCYIRFFVMRSVFPSAKDTLKHSHIAIHTVESSQCIHDTRHFLSTAHTHAEIPSQWRILLSFSIISHSPTHRSCVCFYVLLQFQPFSTERVNLFFVFVHILSPQYVHLSLSLSLWTKITL